MKKLATVFLVIMALMASATCASAQQDYRYLGVGDHIGDYTDMTAFYSVYVTGITYKEPSTATLLTSNKNQQKTAYTYNQELSTTVSQSLTVSASAKFKVAEIGIDAKTEKTVTQKQMFSLTISPGTKVKFWAKPVYKVIEFTTYRTSRKTNQSLTPVKTKISVLDHMLWNVTEGPI